MSTGYTDSVRWTPSGEYREIQGKPAKGWIRESGFDKKYENGWLVAKDDLRKTKDTGRD